MAIDFLPASDNERVIWLNNFQTKIAAYNTTFGLVAADITAIQNDYVAYVYLVNQVEQFKTEGQERVAFKDLLRDGPIGRVGGPFPGAFVPPAAPATVVTPGILPRLRLLVRRLKAHPNYTAAIGRDLGIIAADTGGAIAARPTGKVRALPGSQVEIKFVKRGFPGVQLEARRGAETGWSVLGNYVFSPITDGRAPLNVGQPEVRSYRLRYLRGNVPVGEASDILTVTAAP